MIGLIVWKLVNVHAAVNLTQFYQNVIIDVDEHKMLNNENLQSDTNFKRN